MRGKEVSEVKPAIQMETQRVMSKTRIPRIAITFIVIAVWEALDRREPFRSHLGLTLLGIGVSAIIGAILLYMLGRRKRGEPAA